MNIIGFKEAKCKNCYKCVRNCEVKAISIIDSQAYIIKEKCILCGRCLEVCPQNAKAFISDLDKVRQYLADGIQTVVSLAPSYLGVLEQTKPGQVITALKRLGFSSVHETAEGAVCVTQEYCRLLAEGTMENIITTSCPSANDLVEIYYPELIPYLAPVVSPLVAHGRLLRRQYPDAKLVFIGPCIAKKREVLEAPETCGCIDAVINFNELESWLQEEDISLSSLAPSEPDNPSPAVNRLYPVESGIITSVLTQSDSSENYHKLYVHGLTDCIELLRAMQRGELSRCFIELNICRNGCIKGPCTKKNRTSPFRIRLDMEQLVSTAAPAIPELPPDITLTRSFSDHSVPEELPTPEMLAHILRKFGKAHPKDMLNCGACGYATCREKAIAVYQGKAETGMCLPYMHARAQSVSNMVMDSTPNVIIIVDSDLRIVEFSKAAERRFHTSIARARDRKLAEFIDPVDFEYVLTTHESILSKRVIYEDMNYATLQNIVYMPEQGYLLGIFLDVTAEEEQNRKAYQVKLDTVEMAQRVIDKQMMVAQEIAGLLGETTAETKVTLTRLRDTILHDGRTGGPK